MILILEGVVSSIEIDICGLVVKELSDLLERNPLCFGEVEERRYSKGEDTKQEDKIVFPTNI